MGGLHGERWEDCMERWEDCMKRDGRTAWREMMGGLHEERWEDCMKRDGRTA